MDLYDCPKALENSEKEDEKSKYKKKLHEVKAAMTVKLNNEAGALNRKKKAKELKEAAEAAKAAAAAAQSAGAAAAAAQTAGAAAAPTTPAGPAMCTPLVPVETAAAQETAQAEGAG